MSEAAHHPPTGPADLLRRVQLVELRARRLVEDLLAGPYRSMFRGRGLEFDDIREYQPGDDVRAIDWHTTARTGTVQIKQNVEERCLTVMLAVDLSASGDFGSVPQSKRELAAELSAVLALSAVMNNDRVGLLLFTDAVERYLPPRTGRRQAMAIVAAVLSHKPRSPRTSLCNALQTLGSALRRRATVFLLSDFFDTGFERALRLAGRRHDMVAVSIQDGAEMRLPELGWLVCEGRRDRRLGRTQHQRSRRPPRLRSRAVGARRLAQGDIPSRWRGRGALRDRTALPARSAPVL